MSQIIKEFIDVAEAYEKMTSIPEKLGTTVKAYNEKLKKSDNDFNEKNRAAENNRQNNEIELNTNFEHSINNCDNRNQERISRINSIDAAFANAKSAFNSVIGSIPYEQGKFNMCKSLNEIASKINETKSQKCSELGCSIANLRSQSNELCESEKEKIQKDYEAALKTMNAEYYETVKRIEQEHKRAGQELYDAAVEEIENCSDKNSREVYEMLEACAPSNINYEIPSEMPDTLQIGFISSNISEWKEKWKLNDDLIEEIKSCYTYALKDNGAGEVTLQFPVGISFADKFMNQKVIYEKIYRQKALDYIKALEMRFFMTLPAGKLRVTMIDSVDLGANFAMFSRLGDCDERIISTKIWSEEDRIEEQLKLIIGQIEHVNQDCLRDEFDNIVRYNENVGKNAEPYHVLLIADFPKNFNDKSRAYLEKIISSGPKCGIYTVVAIDKDENQNIGDMSEVRFVTAKKDNKNEFTESILLSSDVIKSDNSFYEFIPVALPEKENVGAIMQILENGIKNSDKIEISYDEISDNLTKNKKRWFGFSSTYGISIPIGLEGAKRSVNINLGGDDSTQHHVLISGTTGSGKSTLLHTITMSLLLRYSPEDVQIFLLDFKRGVEFKVYAKYKLPNFRVISMDTEPEFGLSVLEAADKIMAARANDFKNKTQNRVDKIEDFNIEADKDTTGRIRRAARIVIIIDEFHEMFANEESEIAKNCKKLITNIVKQGRAFGVHLILASQTLPDSLANVYGQMLNRIALQSTVESAKYILDSDNEGIAALANVDAGRGIFNDGGGQKDANHVFRVAMFNEAEQEELLQQILERQHEVIKNVNFGKPRLLLSTIQDDDDNALNRFVVKGELPASGVIGCPLYLGEEIAMVNNFKINLCSKRTQNLLIIGNDAERAELLYGFSALSILFNEYQKERNCLNGSPVITLFDFSSNNSQIFDEYADEEDGILTMLCKRFPDAFRIFGRDSLIDGIETLAKEYENNSDNNKNHYVIFIGLNRAKRLLNSDNSYSASPVMMFKRLIQEGPEKGYNYIIWANEPAGFFTFYGDILNEFDYRLVYDLSDEQYMSAVKSSSMKADMNSTVVSYNSDDNNKKIRVYSKPLKEWLDKFMERLESPCSDNDSCAFGNTNNMFADNNTYVNNEFDEFDEV